MMTAGDLAHPTQGIDGSVIAHGMVGTAGTVTNSLGSDTGSRLKG